MTMSKVAPATPTRIAAQRRLVDVCRRILEGEVGDRGHHQQAGEDQPGNALAEPAEQRQAHAVDDPRPQELQIIDEEGEREGGDGRLVDAVLRQPRGQRRADHRIGKARRNAEEEGGERRLLEIGLEPVPPAVSLAVARDRRCFAHCGFSPASNLKPEPSSLDFEAKGESVAAGRQSASVRPCNDHQLGAASAHHGHAPHAAPADARPTRTRRSACQGRGRAGRGHRDAPRQRLYRPRPVRGRAALDLRQVAAFARTRRRCCPGTARRSRMTAMARR